MARPGARGLGFLPDGAPVLPAGQRPAAEVELTDEAARLAGPGGRLEDYTAGAGRER